MKNTPIADLTPNLGLTLTTAHFAAILEFLRANNQATPKAAYEANLKPFIDSGLNCPAVMAWCFSVMIEHGIIGNAKVED
jgi:hypothetical protein